MKVRTLKKTKATKECLELLLMLPNFHKTGSITGMKKQYYGNDALLVRHGNYIYNCTSEPHIYNNCAE